MNRIPWWAKLIGCAGGYVGVSVLIKEKLGGPDFDEPVDLEGKVAIVTGANSGIGYEVAKGLASRGAKVYLACRDKDKCAAAREDIYLATENKNIFCRYCDLSSLNSVKRFARRIQKDEEKVDILVNNAGIMWGRRQITEDGFERQLGTNHLGHFFLTNLLINKLKSGSPSRIVNVSSTAHYKGKINVEDLNSIENYSESGAYNQSKLANVLFTRQLAKRLDGTGVTANAVHPGIVDTNIVRDTGFFTGALMWILYPVVWPFIKSPRQGAQSVLHVALHPDLEKTSGEFFKLREVAEPSKEALNDQLGLWLWLTSAKWTNLYETSQELGVEPITLLGPAEVNMSIPNVKQKTAVSSVKLESTSGSLVANTLAS